MLKSSSIEIAETKFLRTLGTSLVMLALLLGAKAAGAQEASCSSHGEITKQLEQRYAEAPVSLGLSSSGRLVQVFSTEDGATWTMVLTRPDGLSCVVASGKYWQTATPRKLGPEA
jgi:hypothetical protein